MARERDKGDSFDPRTWGGTGAAPQPPAPTMAKPSPVVQAVKPIASPAGPIAKATAAPVPLRAALGASLLLLAAGVLIARLHPSAPPTERSVAAGDASSLAARAAAAGPAERTLTVDGPAEIATSLAQEGVIPEVAQGAGQEAASVLGPKISEIRLVIGLAGPDGARELSRLEATRGDGSGVVLTARPDGSYISEPKQPARR